MYACVHKPAPDFSGGVQVRETAPYFSRPTPSALLLAEVLCQHPVG